MQQGFRYNKEISVKKHVDLHYLLHLPESEFASNTKWPLILFLHGRDQRGQDLELLKIRGIPKIVEQNKSFPFIVLSPQQVTTYGLSFSMVYWRYWMR
jgi:predicted peptidase